MLKGWNFSPSSSSSFTDKLILLLTSIGMAKCKIRTPLEEEVPIKKILSKTGNYNQLLNLTNVRKDMVIYNHNDSTTNVGPDPVDPALANPHSPPSWACHLRGGDLVHLGHGVTQLQVIELNGLAFFPPIRFIYPLYQ